MPKLFKTFKPKNSVVKKYVDYYYLDIKPTNIVNEFQCFPHFNNTISLYRSHKRLDNGEMVFEKTAKPFQIFTPIREKILNVRQAGPVHRVVLVFHPFGIQQFYGNLNFSDYIEDYEFFTQNELKELFSTNKTNRLTHLLDDFLEKRFKKFENPILEKSIHYIFQHYENFSVAGLSHKMGISRQHLNRLYQTHFGLSIKKFHDIVIFRRTIQQKLFENPELSFTELAYAFNFSDQSHLIKAYQNLTQNSPRAFFTKGTILGNEDTFWHIKP